MAAPDTKVRVEFRGVLANGEVLTDAFAFAVVFFQLTPDSPADQKDDEASNV